MKPGTAGIPGLGSGGTRLAFGGPLRRPIGAVGRSCRGGIGHRQRRSQTTGRRPSSEIAGRGPAPAPTTAVRRVIASRVRRVCRRARGRNSRAESRIGSANICPRRLRRRPARRRGRCPPRSTARSRGGWRRRRRRRRCGSPPSEASPCGVGSPAVVAAAASADGAAGGAALTRSSGGSSAAGGIGGVSSAGIFAFAS